MLTHDHLGASDACAESPASTYRGPGPGSEGETRHLLGAFGLIPQYRTVLATDTHAYGKCLLFTEGLNTTVVGSPPNPTFNACGTNSDCTTSDLRLVSRLAGTDRLPRMRNEEVPAVAHRVGAVFRSVYAVSGRTANETVYESLSGGVCRFVSIPAELTHTACGFYAERIPPARVSALASNFQTFIKKVTDLADALACGAHSTVLFDFDLPIVERRAFSGTAGGHPRWPICSRRLDGRHADARRRGLGHDSLDDVRPGVFYRLHRFTPTRSLMWSPVAYASAPRARGAGRRVWAARRVQSICAARGGFRTGRGRPRGPG